MAQIDKKQKNLIIGIAAAVLIVILAIGIAVWVLASDKEEKAPSTPYVNDTPTSAPAQQVGSIALTPAQVALVRSPDGRIAGTAEVAALFQDFYFTSIKFEGDARLGYTSNCPTGSTPLKAGARCQINITLDESPGKAGTPSPTPSLIVVGETTTPGGNKITAEGRAPLSGAAISAGATNPDGTPLAGATGVPGATGIPGAAGTPLTSGGVAPGGIDPYGPVQPAQGSSPPVDYSQGSSQQVAQGQRPLTPREQFILARRQAVLGNVVLRNAQTSQVVSSGDWDEIKVPKSVSSAPQDMSRVVTMDRVITAVLARPFDSRQSQQVVAQVDRNVYGAMGRNILIPRGSTIIGQMAGGADRVAVIWTQIIRPDGARFVFNGTGGDAMGQAGVPGRVNNRWLARIGAGVLGTVLKVSTALVTNAQEQAVAVNNNAGGAQNAPTTARNNGAIVTDIVTQDINSILAPIIARQQALLPIITVPAGTRMTILPTQDLVMRAVDRPVVVRQQYPRQMNGGAQISAPPEVQGAQVSYDQQVPTSQPEVNFSGGARQQPTQQSVARTLSSTPAAPSTTPPWGSN